MDDNRIKAAHARRAAALIFRYLLRCQHHFAVAGLRKRFNHYILPYNHAHLLHKKIQYPWRLDDEKNQFSLFICHSVFERAVSCDQNIHTTPTNVIHTSKHRWDEADVNTHIYWCLKSKHHCYYCANDWMITLRTCGDSKQAAVCYSPPPKKKQQQKKHLEYSSQVIVIQTCFLYM